VVFYIDLINPFSSVFYVIEKVLETLGCWFNSTTIDFLQKVFYILSNTLLILGTIRFFRKGRNKNTKVLNGAKFEKTVKTVDLSLEPEIKGEELGQTLNNLNRKGVKRMKDYLKSMSKCQIISIIVMIVSFALGVVFVNVPALAGSGFENAIYYIGATFFGSAFTGAFAQGKNTKFSEVKSENKAEKHEIKRIKSQIADLEYQYREIIEIAKSIQATGGRLTSDETIKYERYTLQKNSLVRQLAEAEARYKALEEQKQKETKAE
jgi:hypothetical protein